MCRLTFYFGVPNLTLFAVNGILLPTLRALGGGSPVGALFSVRMSRAVSRATKHGTRSHAARRPQHSVSGGLLLLK